MVKVKKLAHVLTFVVAILVAGVVLSACAAQGGAPLSEAKATSAGESIEEPASDVSDSDGVDPSTPVDHKVLIAYFSYTGHLDSMAHWIQDETGGDLVRVTARDAYSDVYDETVDRAKEEQDADARPAIEVDLTQEELDAYDTVFFGFPVWWYDLPMPMWTFLESYDFTGKTIYPFISHEGTSNGGSAFENMQKLAPAADIRSDTYLSIRGDEVDSSEETVRTWVQELGFSR